MAEVNIHSFVVETTRRCNMRCAHCLRGNPQNRSMPYEVLKNSLRHVGYISCVTFTGGEPSLPSGVRVLDYFTEIVRNWGIRVGSFYIVTNGKRYNREFIDSVRSLYYLCEDNEISGVEFSTDPYHESQNSRLYWELEEISELEIPGLHFGRKKHYEEGLILEGRCNWGYRELSIPELTYRLEDPEADESDLYVDEPALYLNCKGNVILGCDWSYSSQDDPSRILCRYDELTPELIMRRGKNEDE